MSRTRLLLLLPLLSALLLSACDIEAVELEELERIEDLVEHTAALTESDFPQLEVDRDALFTAYEQHSFRSLDTSAEQHFIQPGPQEAPIPPTAVLCVETCIVEKVRCDAQKGPTNITDPKHYVCEDELHICYGGCDID